MPGSNIETELDCNGPGINRLAVDLLNRQSQCRLYSRIRRGPDPLGCDLCSLKSRIALVALEALCSLKSLIALISLEALKSLIALVALEALSSLIALVALEALCSLKSLISLISLEALKSLISLWTSDI